MSRYRRYDIVERSPYYVGETCFPSFPIVEDELDLIAFPHSRPYFFDEFDPVMDPIQIERNPYLATSRRISRRIGFRDVYLQTLCDRVSDLERLVRKENTWRRRIGGIPKYTWTAEIKRPVYQWTTAIKDGKYEKKGLERSYKWTAEIKGKGGDYLPIERTYTVNVSDGDCESSNCRKIPRIVEIEEPSDRAAILLRFLPKVWQRESKRKEDAASLIQMNYRAHHLRMAHALRATRDFAVAKNKLKEIRSCLYNFTYRRRLSLDAEERHRFSQKIIVLLLTVDAIEGADLMVRVAKKCTLEELETMLDTVDPQLSGKSLAVWRKTYDTPDGKNNKELVSGPAEVVRMLD